jgi:DNA polymerase
MSDSLDALRGYVQMLRERDGVRQVRLSRDARQGLAKLAGEAKAAKAGSPVAAVYDRRPASPSVPTSSSLERSARPQDSGGHRPPLQTAPPPAANEPPLTVSGSTKAEQLKYLAQRAAACVKCPHLVARRHNVVFGVGNPEARLVFVGEAPGEEEDLQGEPFVGRAGQLLTKMIQAMGLTREQVYIGNIVKCRPDMPEGVPGNRKPTKQEMETCVPYLRAQLEVIKPVAMVALGATAVEGLLGPVGTIGSLRGRFLDYRGTPLMPTYHPSYLLRNQNNTEKRKVWEDLLKVMERLEMTISEKQRNFFLKA